MATCPTVATAKTAGSGTGNDGDGGAAPGEVVAGSTGSSY